MSLQPALGHQSSHTQATRVVWPLFPPTLSSQPPPLILSSLPHTFLLPIPDSLLFSAPDPSCTPPATGAPTRLSSSLVSLSSASHPPPASRYLRFPLVMNRGSMQGASPLPPPRSSRRHRLRVHRPLANISPATSAGTLPTASSTCVRTTMTAPPSTVWAVPWPCSRGPPRGQASRRRRERQ